jgi:hypothetical protein
MTEPSSWWKKLQSRRRVLTAGAGAVGAAVAGALARPLPASAVTFSEPLTVDFGPTGSWTVGTPLGNGPGLIFMAPNGNRRDITGWIGGLYLNASSSADPAGTTGLVISESGNVGVGEANPQAALHVAGDAWATGTFQSVGGDCSEQFPVKTYAEPGSVMIMTEDGQLEPSSATYDKRAAGVVSGAGGLSPGIVLNGGGGEGRQPIALSGRVFCKVDAGSCAVQVGDLLTTSSTPGHAMAATDQTRAYGTVIGKALAPLPYGTGLIPILVSLQ